MKGEPNTQSLSGTMPAGKTIWRLRHTGPLTKKGTPRKLAYSHWRQLDRLGLHGAARVKAREALRKHEIREKNKRDGLTTRGTARKNQRWPMELRDLTARERNRILCNDWLWRNRYSKGLTALGQLPAWKRKTPQRAAWEEFRSQIEVGIVSAEDVYQATTRAAYDH